MATTTAQQVPDDETARWLRDLRAGARDQEAATERLHALLLRVARRELRRRARDLPFAGAELDDLAHHAAADAAVAVVRKLDDFRGQSRFTTWACKFVMLEVSRKAARHMWQERPVFAGEEDWEQLPARFGFSPSEAVEWRELIDALRTAIVVELTDHQRRVFVAIVLHAVPLDVVVAELGTSRNAIYKTIHDARRRLQAALAAGGFREEDAA
ncbi:RNA polymerase sigma factor [Conexibacter sp. SYSU D00693]|uniref:RNA polymerase sigma factor n=1 Tax=Conexibacter sp. SYSU D00693 TaxID=2812560 RepID=UPI00196A2D20|nr:sigma-70 family RNA polymerase sigma factor [Conexibacter sp. SYSU D00693]